MLVKEGSRPGRWGNWRGAIGGSRGTIGEAGLGQLVEPFFVFLKSMKNDTELIFVIMSIFLYILQQYLVIVSPQAAKSSCFGA
jgi:hypothetical protein